MTDCLNERLYADLYEKSWRTLQWLERTGQASYDKPEDAMSFLEWIAWPVVANLGKADLWELTLHASPFFYGDCVQRLQMDSLIGSSVVKYMSNKPKLRFLQISATAALVAEVLHGYPWE